MSMTTMTTSLQLSSPHRLITPLRRVAVVDLAFFADGRTSTTALSSSKSTEGRTRSLFFHALTGVVARFLAKSLELPPGTRAKELLCDVSKAGAMRVESKGTVLLAGHLVLPVDRTELSWLVEGSSPSMSKYATSGKVHALARSAIG